MRQTEIIFFELLSLSLSLFGPCLFQISLCFRERQVRYEFDVQQMK